MTLETKRFTKNDSGFVCEHCGREVPPLGYTSRNHCPFCLWSKHVDVLPGDRACACGGLMEPVSCVPDSRRGYILTHRCVKCGFTGRNKAAVGSETPDDLSLLIQLTANNK